MTTFRLGAAIIRYRQADRNNLFGTDERLLPGWLRQGGDYHTKTWRNETPGAPARSGLLRQPLCVDCLPEKAVTGACYRW